MNASRFKNRLVARIITRFPTLAKRFLQSYSPDATEGVPWTPMRKSLSESTVALVTTGGVHHRDQAPFNMMDKNGDPSYRIIDAGRPASDLMITHDYYDHSDADRDINIVFPLERLRELEKKGIIGKSADRHYSFMGHITGPYVSTLSRHTAREVAFLLKQAGVDSVVLTPG
jgi:D-proline reductase (dithiol) PrdB